MFSQRFLLLICVCSFLDCSAEPYLDSASQLFMKIVSEYGRTVSHCHSMTYRELHGTTISGVALASCTLIGADGLKFMKASTNFKDISGQVSFPNVTIGCFPSGNSMHSYREAIFAEGLNILIDIKIARNDANGHYSINYQLARPVINIAVYGLHVVIDDGDNILTYIQNELLKYLNPYFVCKLQEAVSSIKIDYYYFPLSLYTTSAPEIETSTPTMALSQDLHSIIRQYGQTEPVYFVEDKEITHKENFGILTVTSDLLLSNCTLRGLSNMKPDHIEDGKYLGDFKITKGQVTFPNISASCQLTIFRSGVHWQSRIAATAFDTPAELELLQNHVINHSSIKYRLIREPKVNLTVDDISVLLLIIKYHLDDLSKYLSFLFNDYLKTKVPQRLNRLINQ